MLWRRRVRVALTADGKGLTEAHKLAQVEVGARAAGDVEDMWGSLNVERPDPWIAATAAALSARKDQSVLLAGTYLAEYTAVEDPGYSIDVVSPSRGGTRLLTVAAMAPVEMRKLLDAGVDPGVASREVERRFKEIVAAEAMRTGRWTVQDSAGRSERAVGWRRVTDGNPCAFCAMLASRGPVYTVSTAPLTQFGDRYHKGCGCTAEPVYGKWIPSPDEMQFISSYERAAREADAADEARIAPVTIRDEDGNIVGRTEDNILYRMRRNNPELFSDGSKRRKR